MLKLSDKSPRALYKEFQFRYDDLLKLITELEADGIDIDTLPAKYLRGVQNRVIRLVNEGGPLVSYVLSNKEVPRRQAKSLEMVARLFNTVRRAPTKPHKWFTKNHKRFVFLLGTEGLPEKTLGSEALFKMGDFTVHNTVGASDEELEQLVSTLKKASGFVRKSGVPHSTSLLYGDVYITGQLTKRENVAWYNIKDDDIYFRPKIQANHDTIRSVVHELGHRLWRLFLSQSVIKGWTKWHRVCGGTNPRSMPEVGEPLGFPVKGDANPIILRIEGSKYYLSENGYLTHRGIRDAYIEEFGFPSPYSATNSEEHFCEAFSFYCLGTLGPVHERAFESLVINQDDYEDVETRLTSKAASRRRGLNHDR